MMALLWLLAKTFVYVVGSIVMACSLTQRWQWWWAGLLFGLVLSVDEVRAYLRQRQSRTTERSRRILAADGSAHHREVAPDMPHGGPMQHEAEATGTGTYTETAGAVATYTEATGTATQEHVPAASSREQGSDPPSLRLLMLEIGAAMVVFVLIATGAGRNMSRWWLGVLVGLASNAKEIKAYVLSRRKPMAS